MILRKATSNDAEACADILRGWMNENDWYDTPHKPDEDVPFLTSLIVGGWTTVADEDGVKGFLVQDKSWINCLYLAPEARGQGVGKRLLCQAKNTHPEGLQLWTFQANTDAHRFYIREGFREVERTDGSGNDEKLPDIRFVWRMFHET